MRLHIRVLSRALVFLAAVFAPALAAHAQNTVEKLTFTGAAPYTDAELTSVSGLAPGQLLAQDSLVNAAHHLLDTGLFDDAQVTLSGNGKARTVHFDLKPTPLDKLLPVSLENFVWLTPAELTEGLHTQLPLYRGVASDAGNFPDLIQVALTTLLSAKGVSATVTHNLIEPSTQHPVRVVDFSVEKPATPVASIQLSIKSSSPEAVAAAKVALRRLTYNEGLTGLTIQDFLLSPSRNAGYIAAKVDSLQREYTSTGAVHGVTVTAAISPGAPYKISTLTWDPTPTYSAADFTRDTRLHPGDLANATELAKPMAPSSSRITPTATSTPTFSPTPPSTTPPTPSLTQSTPSPARSTTSSPSPLLASPPPHKPSSTKAGA